MKKRVFALLIAVLLMLGSLAGCNTETGTNGTSDEKVTEPEKTAKENEEEAAADE